MQFSSMRLASSTLLLPTILDHMRRKSYLFAMLMLVGLLTGCTSLVRPEQNQQSTWLAIPPGGSVSQTFMAKFDGLSGVQSNFRSDQPVSGELVLRIYSMAPERRLLEEVVREVVADEALGARSFPFKALPDSGNQDYLMEFSFLGQGSLEIAAASGDAYLNGSAYQNDVPQDMQLAFGLIYWTPQLIYGLSVDWIRWLFILLAAGILFLLPGWALMDLVWRKWRDLDFMVKLGISGSVGLALYPVLFLWVDLIQLKPGPLLAWLPPLLSAGLLAWRHRRVFGSRTRAARRHGEQPAGRVGIHFDARWIDVFLFLVVILLAAGGRFWVVRTLQVPHWGDSVQHTIMAQLMLDNGGLFSSWQPYAPYVTLTTHYGFSSAVAIMAWLTGLPAEQATLFTGQVLNLMAILAIFPLAYWASNGKRWAGLGALIVSGLLLPVPGMYVNWGRYAQLAGQVILPGIMWMTVTLIEAPRPSRKHAAAMAGLSGMVLAGMALSYYRVPIYYALFVAAWLVFWVFMPENRLLKAYQSLLISLGIAALVAILLLLPWIPRLLGSNLGEIVAAGIEHATPLETRLADFSNWRFFPDYIPYPYVILALIGAGWGLWRRRWGVVAMPLWVVLLVAYFFGGLFQLPAANMLQTYAILIMLYIPVGVLCGFLFGGLIEWLMHLSPRWGLLATGLATLGLALWGGLQQARLGDPVTYALFTNPDRRALTWIQENTEEDARFLVESFTIYSGRSSVGSDGGWWIPLFGKRQNTMPPQYALLNEQPVKPGYSAQVTDLVALLEAQPISSPQTITTLCTWGITHVYIGQRQGEVGDKSRQLFIPGDLLDQPAFELIYHQDRVYVFELTTQACQGTP